MKTLARVINESLNEKEYQGQALRDSTDTEFVIFYKGNELKTSKTGSMNSANGLVLTATLPNGEQVFWRSKEVGGKKGFSYTGYLVTKKDGSKEYGLPNDMRNELEYKLSN